MLARGKNYGYASLLLACLFLFLGGLSTIHAATFVVTTTSDGPSDGTCDAAGTGDGCTLREAINAANSDARDNTISFDETIFSAPRKSITLGGTQLPNIISSGGRLNITAPAAGVVINGDNRSRVFRVELNGRLTLTGLTITGGNAGSGVGGGISNASGELNLINCTLNGNRAFRGGGIFNQGTTSLTNCTLSGNHSSDAGGAIFTNGVLNLTNCTISRNTTSNTTGGIYNIFLEVNISNTILHLNPAGNLRNDRGTVNSEGYNISTDGSGPSTSTDRRNTDPLLDSAGLKDNGGPTQTIALQSNSPAIDTGETALATDQRGRPRPIDGNSDGTAADDRGAFEYDPPQTGNPSFVVNTLADTDDGACGLINCTLREAINANNTQAGANSITFGQTVFAASRQTIVLGGLRLPTISGNLTITAPEAGVEISGAGVSSIFAVNINVTVTLTGLTIRDGNAGNNSGGGITNLGTLIVEYSTLVANTASEGGGIANLGRLRLTNSTLSANTASSSGGGILNNSDATLTIQSSTLSDNSASFGGGIANTYGTLNIGNTILEAGAQGRNLENASGTVNSQGYNLSSDASGPNNGATDRLNTNPLLGPLQNNGGPTPTHALLPGSPAINTGNTTLTVDQRGVPRPQGPADDIGAFEAQAPCPTITLTPATLPAGQAGTSYNQTITAAGGTGSFTFAVTAGSLPNGLTLSSGGLLSGAPTSFGDFSFTARATDGNGCTGTRPYSLTINPPCPTITISPSALNNGTVGTAYNASFTQSGGSGTITWSVSAGALPSGLQLSATTGALAGTPSAANAFNFTIKATAANGCFATRAYTVTVSEYGTGLMFYPLPAPVRLLDTRPGASPNACSQPNAPIAANSSRVQPARNFCGIPAQAQALTGHITTIQSGGGYLTLYPSGAARPTVASTNYAPNEIVNNVFTVGLGNADGAFDIYALNTTDVVVDVTGYYATPGPGGLYFHPLPAPVRLLETRAGQPVGCVKPGAPLAGGADALHTATTACTGIPAAARAIVGNATTVSPQGPGYLTLFPAAAARPLIASSNYDTHQIVNGPFTTGLSAAGEFKVFTLATTELVIDVLGYYSAEATDANGAGLLFTSLARPVRWLETRAGQAVGCFKPGQPLNGQQSYEQMARGVCDGQTIPAEALAVVGNATVVYPVTAGYLTLWPSNALQPTTATSNYGVGQIVNRHFIVGLGNADGAFKMFSLATTDLVIDLSGYFAP